VKGSFIRFFLSVFFSLFLLVPAGWAANFEADMEIEGPMGAMTGKIYVLDEKQRQELTGPMGRTDVITEGREGTALILIHEQKAYMEMGKDAYPGAAMAPTDLESLQEDGDGQKTMKMEELGQETVEGFLCEKIRLVDPESPETSTLIWFSKELGFPLKAVSQSPEGTSTVLYRNIVLGSVTESRFEIPAGYSRLEIPGF
jgi:outer membrane lipoprotein-sorting protein